MLEIPKGKIMIFIMFFILLGNLQWGIASEQAKIKDVKISLAILSRSALHYMPKEVIDECTKVGIPCSYNTPFLPLNESLGSPITGSDLRKEDVMVLKPYIKKDHMNSFNDLIQNVFEKESIILIVKHLQALPLTLFSNKKKGDILCTIALSENRKVNLICDVNENELPLKNLLDAFCKMPAYWIIIPAWCAKIIDHNYQNIENSFIEQQILEKTTNGTIIHGPKGYFAYQKDREKSLEEQPTNSDDVIVPGQKGYFEPGYQLYRRIALLGGFGIVCFICFFWKNSNR
jgi:hypothetical protein